MKRKLWKQLRPPKKNTVKIPGSNVSKRIIAFLGISGPTKTVGRGNRGGRDTLHEAEAVDEPDLRLHHPELGEVPCGVGVLRPKRRPERVDVAQPRRVRLERTRATSAGFGAGKMEPETRLSHQPHDHTLPLRSENSLTPPGSLGRWKKKGKCRYPADGGGVPSA